MIAGQQYALVADYNWIVENFDYGNSNFAGQQLGGKIGIVKDPFGTPIDLKPTPIPSVVNGQTVTSYAPKLGAQPTKINSIGSEVIGWIYGMAAPEDNKEPTDGTTETHNGVTFIIQQPIDNQSEIPDMDFDVILEDEEDLTIEEVEEAVKEFRESLIAPEGTEGISREEWIKQMTEATLEELKKSGWLLSEPTSQFGNDFIEVAPHSAPAQ